MDPKENHTRLENQSVDPLEINSRETSGRPSHHQEPPPVFTLLPGPASTRPVAVWCLLASSAPRAGRNFCRPEPVCCAQCCRPASRRRGCCSLPLAAVTVEFSPASLVEEHSRLDCVYGRSAGRFAGWCFCIRASSIPWQGTSGRAPTSK